MNRTMVMGIGTAILAGTAVLVFTWGTSAPAGTVLYASDPDVVALGQTIYTDNCAACHGANLEGESNWRSPGSDGRLPAPPHDETYEGVLTDDEIIAVLSYIKSTWPQEIRDRHDEMENRQ